MGKREVIVSTEKPLTAKERRNYKKEHPGERLSFFLRFPNFPLIVSATSFLLVVVKWIIDIIFKQNSTKVC